MKHILTILLILISFGTADAYKFVYKFNNTPVSEAIVRISKDHPDVNIAMIYKELDGYRTSARVQTDNAYEALRQTIGLNPVTVTEKKNIYYLEALQHGRYCYTGQVTDTDNQPLPTATVMLLAPRDSTVITYGTSDSDGRFSIPCDHKKVIVKVSYVGYKPAYRMCDDFAVDKMTMEASPHLLNTVTVEADNTFFYTDRSVYIPSSQQKNSSRTAIDLLRRMAIPQIVTNPMSDAVTDVAGNEVQIYVNYMQADANDLDGMKVTDVRKVEFIENPVDPRFRGASRVINIILQQYEYGGYTKLSADVRTLNGFSNTDNVFSKFTYKRVTYDLFAGYNNSDYRHTGADTHERYTLGEDGNTTTVVRDETMLDSHEKKSSVPVTLRTTYQADKFTARNSISFTHNSIPVSESSGALRIDAMPDKDYDYRRNTPTRYNAASYTGSFWASLGAGFSVDVAPRFAYTHRDNISSYTTNLSSPIYYRIHEDSYNWNVQLTGRKSFSQKHNINIGFTAGQNINKLLYAGTDNFGDSYNITCAGGFGGYTFNNRKLNIYSRLGFGYERNILNGKNNNDIYPYFRIEASYKINKNSSLFGFVYLENSTPSISWRASDVIRSNELTYITGNPDLDIWHNYRTHLAYNWYYRNIWKLAVFGGYNWDEGRVAAVYEPYDDGKALIRRFINNGNYGSGYLGAAVNCNLLNNALQLYANMSQNYYRTTGIYDRDYYPFRIQLQAAYYHKNFNIMAWWGSPLGKLTENSNIIIRERSFHGISLGWGNGTWVVNINAVNLFNRGWLSSTWERETPLYTEYQTYYSPSAHPRINLGITYTIGYGRKVNRGNEIEAQDNSAPSAIIR